MKTLKIYLKNCPESKGTQIYCIKHGNYEDLSTLKEKISLRVPNLRSTAVEPNIYWFDLENDKIRITCDDDLKFFMEESDIRKLTFEYAKSPEDSSRKRRSASSKTCEDDDDNSEFSKRLRKIDLSSDSSPMETDADEEVAPVHESVTSSADIIPSTSTVARDNEPKIIEIISVETIKEPIVIEDNQATAVEENQSNNTVALSNEADPKVAEKSLSTNRIVIEDSSDEEERDSSGNQHSSGNRRQTFFDNNRSGSFSYSFNSNVHGARNENYHDHSNRYRRRRNHSEHAFFRDMAQNIARENARIAQETARNVRNVQEQVENVRRTAQENLRNFQAHFRPLFSFPNNAYNQRY